MTGPSQLITGIPLSREPIARYHLLMNPHIGGIPIRASEHSVKHHRTTGISLPIPVSSSTFLRPVR